MLLDVGTLVSTFAFLIVLAISFGVIFLIAKRIYPVPYSAEELNKTLTDRLSDPLNWTKQRVWMNQSGAAGLYFAVILVLSFIATSGISFLLEHFFSISISIV